MQEYPQTPETAFSRSHEKFTAVVAELSTADVSRKTHAEVEDHLGIVGRELLQMMYQDHLDMRARREARHEDVVDSEGVHHTRVESGHCRQLKTIFGEVRVAQLAYRSPDVANVYPADAVLNLPTERHSHGLRKLAAVEAVRGSFDDTIAAIERTTRIHLGKRQVEGLAQRAAVDVEDFYATRKPGASPAGDVLVLSVDGKGIVMRPDGLRVATARAAEKAVPKLTTRLSRGEKRNRKRMAEVGTVYDIIPVARLPSDIITTDGTGKRTAGPTARDKWLVAGLEKSSAGVIAQVFDEAERRDPEHLRPWVALVDGNTHQIDCIRAEAKRRAIKVDIVVDIVHVIEYLWKAAWCFFKEGDPAVETWVATQALRVLEGDSSVVAGAMKRKATCTKLSTAQRGGVDTCAQYLINKRPYLRYNTALASGWPIATGVIEGACRHLVKDRMDLTGSRWGLSGAEAILKLRAVSSNGDLDAYWAHHLSRERERVHLSRFLNGQPPAGLSLAA